MSLGAPVAALLLAVPTATAQPQPRRPAFSWGLESSNVQAGDPVKISYRVTKAPKKAKIFVQRTMGTRSIWTNIKRLRARSGEVTLPGVPQGEYRYRILAKKKRKVWASAPKTLRSYGQVPLAKLLEANETGALQYADSVQIGQSIFRYVVRQSRNDFGINPKLLKIDRSTCSSLTVVIGSPNALVTVSSVQEAADPQAMEVSAQTVGTFTVQPVLGHAIEIDATVDGMHTWYADGYGTCYTADGNVQR